MDGCEIQSWHHEVKPWLKLYGCWYLQGIRPFRVALDLITPCCAAISCFNLFAQGNTSPKALHTNSSQDLRAYPYLLKVQANLPVAFSSPGGKNKQTIFPVLKKPFKTNRGNKCIYIHIYIYMLYIYIYICYIYIHICKQ